MDCGSAANLAPELQRQVTMFFAGDEKYAGQWLLEFRRADGAWDVCVQAMQAGVPTCCDEELLQEFCAQTLAHLSRAFSTRIPESARQSARDTLEALLGMHAYGPSVVWKQLALALTCADLWLGTSVIAPVLTAGDLPAEVRRELLVLPAELLFNDRALPLDDVRLRRTAAGALYEACEAVFPFLLGGGAAPVPMGEEGKSLQVLAAWLRAVRKSMLLLAGRDEAAPLRCLAIHGHALVSAAQLCPPEACEVAQQLALWKGSDQELSLVLRPLLDCLWSSDWHLTGREVLLPLLQDLAGNCWPRAALGDMDLDWQNIAVQALAVIHASMDEGDADSVDVEAALGVWQTFAETLGKGQDDTKSSSQASDGVFEPTLKRTRRRDQWHAPRDRIAQSQALPHLFHLFIQQLLERLKAPPVAPSNDELTVIWELRAAAQPVLAAWATLLGEAHCQAQSAEGMEAETQAWFEAAWSPLDRLCKTLAAGDSEHVVTGFSGENFLTEEICSEAEVVLWFSAALASSWPQHANTVPVASLVPELGSIDIAPYPWRALLWSSACSFASRAPGEHCATMLEWMLKRSPATPEAAEYNLQELTELPYAQALEAVSRHLPTGAVHVEVGDRLAQLAFATFPFGTGHKDSSKAQALLLLAMRHAMGSDAALLCKGLSEKALPELCPYVDAEAATARNQNDPEWNAAQSLFSTLISALPAGLSMDMNHPAGVLWNQHWKYLEAALLQWPVSSSTEQPVTAATEALTAAVSALPILLPSTLQLISRSASEHALPDVQMTALHNIVVGVQCPPVDTDKAADLLATAIFGVVEALLLKSQEVLCSPSTLTALFQLLSESIRCSLYLAEGSTVSSPTGPCGGKLRSTLLVQPAFAIRCLELASEALPECHSEAALTEMLRFAARILAGDDVRDPQSGSGPLRDAVAAKLPMLCSAICRALTTKECLLDLESLAVAAEVFASASTAFPTEMPGALDFALQHVQVPDWSRRRLQQHFAARHEWGSQRIEWLEQLQQIVREWQSERRHTLL